MVSLDDKILDLAAADPGKHQGLTAAALLAALGASRTGGCATSLRNPGRADSIIRSELAGCSWSRVARVPARPPWPCTRPRTCSIPTAGSLKRGVLVVGPNATFLRYIDQVLPSLGETSVLLLCGEFRGISAQGSDRGDGRDQGQARHGRRIAAAPRTGSGSRTARSRPDRPETLRLTPSARQGQGAGPALAPAARPGAAGVARELADALTRQLAARIGANVSSREFARSGRCGRAPARGAQRPRRAGAHRGAVADPHAAAARGRLSRRTTCSPPAPG